LFARLSGVKNELTSAVNRALFALVGVALPLAIVMSACAIPLVRFLYGAKWAQAAAPLKYLAFFGLARVIEDVLTQVLVAVGDVRRVMVLKGVWLAALVPAIIVGARANGLAGVGQAQLLVVGLITLPLTLLAAGRFVSLPAALAFVPRLALAGSTAGAAWLAVHHAVSGAPVFWRLAAESATIGAAFVLVAGAPLIQLIVTTLFPRLSGGWLGRVGRPVAAAAGADTLPPAHSVSGDDL
jgi:O-antigen/teichoic acid export membrane protein